MLRHTKIVATLGPSTTSYEQIEAVILAGANVLRLNFSHGEADDHRQRASIIREVAQKHNLFVAILADLQGPKIRIARFKENKIELSNGDTFVLDSTLGYEDGDKHQVGIDYLALITDSNAGDVLLLDDGRVVLEVTAVSSDKITTTVTTGGPLSNNKGINRLGGGLSAKALTDKDKADIIIAAEIQADYIAVSFPRDEHDMHEARELLKQAGSHAGLVAKIERAETIADNEILDNIIRASEVVMVARGDLAVEIGDATLVGVQKHIIRRARSLNKVVITATQMMESMITSPMPTRAEVSDVANAVFDHTDAVMLSAETAAGEYPVQAVEAMARICLGAESSPSVSRSGHRLNEEFNDIDETVALAAIYTANHLEGVKAIICMTASGATPKQATRLRTALPVFALSENPTTQTKVAMYRNVHTIPFLASNMAINEINQKAIDEVVKLGVAKEGDLVVITKGDYVDSQGGTNTLKIVRVGEKIQ
ncbi:pyruvate kinase ['Osedax' symbiont bacterium Rs2_46_30_T18]|nr:pyruvate kinase ['Osedax' symbiont bacterium Rs2_46_30_T18]